MVVIATAFAVVTPITLLSPSLNHNSHLAAIDDDVQIVCAITGQRFAHFLMPILYRAALSQSCATVHGSAFVRNGVIFAGGPQNGKRAR